MASIDELRGKVPPEIEEKLDVAVKRFRENHRHPANLALHAAGYFSILKGLGRFAHGKRFRAVFLILFGLGMVLAGHEIEGTDAFAVLKDDQGSGGNGRI